MSPTKAEEYMEMNRPPRAISEILADMVAAMPDSHTDSLKTMGRRIRELRETRGLSQRQLAFPGCSAAYISRLEAGDRRPSIQLLHRLALRLYTPTIYLSHGYGSPNDPPTEAILALSGNDRRTSQEMTELAVEMRVALVKSERL